MRVGVGEFWASRVRADQDGGSNATVYVIDGVVPPDENAGVVNNSVYTNAVAAFSLRFAVHVAEVFVSKCGV